MTALGLGLGLGFGLGGPHVSPAWVANRMASILGSKIIDQWVSPTGDPTITGWTGVNGKVLASVESASYTRTTLGGRGLPAVTSSAAAIACLRCADVGAPVKALISVCKVPTSIPDATNYQCLMGTGAVAAAGNKCLVQPGFSVFFITAGLTHYIDNVATRTLPATGTTMIVRAEIPANTDQSVQLGYGVAPFVWRAPVGYLAALNAVPTAGESASVQNLLRRAFL